MGLQQHNAPQANRPSGLPPNFQAPPNMPNINFNAPVIRLGTGSGKSGPPTAQEMDRPMGGGHGRPGLGMDRGADQGRPVKEVAATVMPPTPEEKLRTIFIHQIPESLHAAEAMENLLRSVGSLRRWDPSDSVMDDYKGTKFGFALFNDHESVATALKLLHDESIEVPVKRQSSATEDAPQDETYEGFEKTKLQVTVDPNTVKYLESRNEGKEEDAEPNPALERARTTLRSAIRELFYPPAGAGADADGDVAMKNAENGESVEVVNITLAQDDELADIPAEMREVVAGEIAAFRERSNQRDLERLKKEEEMEEMERQRSGAGRTTRLDVPSSGAGSNAIPLGPRGGGPLNAPSGPKGQNGSGRMPFVSGGISNAEYSVYQEDEDTDADDDELQRRRQAKQKAEEDQLYIEAERKWVNREHSRQAALEREQDRERKDSESVDRRKQEQLEREKSWDDEKESSRKSHPYYKDHASWVRKRQMDRQEEEARDESDRRAEQSERRREKADLERARGMADSFLDQQAEEMEKSKVEAAPAPQPFKLSLGAAAQKAQASRGAQRRTVAEVEGLLDDEEADTTTKRALIPLDLDKSSGTAGMSEEEISQAVRALAQEIPSDKDGLWKWEVKWEFMDESIVRGKLRPFVEKKIVEYLGVQEEMLVEAVEEHLRNHGTAAGLVDELEGVRIPRLMIHPPCSDMLTH